MDKKNIGIDLSHAQECTIDFFENISLLAENVHISLFNIPSDIFALISFMKFDKIVDNKRKCGIDHRTLSGRERSSNKM